LISTEVIFQAENIETVLKWYFKSGCVLRDHYDDEREKIVFTTQHQTCKTKTDFWSQTGLVLRPTVSIHITGISSKFSIFYDTSNDL